MVAAYEMGRIRDLDNAPGAIADIAGCGGTSQLEADIQERNERNHGRSVYSGLWRIGTSEARNHAQGAAAATGCGVSAARNRVRVELRFLRLYLKIQNYFLHSSSIVF